MAAAPDGLEAVCLAADRRFDAILLDLFIPEMDGMTALATCASWRRELPT